MVFSGKTIDPPAGFHSEVFVVRPVVAADVHLDYEAIMASRENLRLWEQGTWPEDDFTVEDNLKDLIKMEDRHNEGYAFGYTVMTPDETQCLGCIYVMPPEAKMYHDAEVTAVGDLQWADVDATVYFWVRTSRLAEGLDRTLLDAMCQWFDEDWGFARYVVATSAPFLQQVTMIEATDRKLQFTIALPDQAAPTRAYGGKNAAALDIEWDH